MMDLARVPFFTLSTTHTGTFKTLLEAILEGKILAGARRYLRFNLEWWAARIGPSISMRDILTQPEVYDVGGRKITLSPSQRFDLMLCGTEAEKVAFLRSVLGSDGEFLND